MTPEPHPQPAAPASSTPRTDAEVLFRCIDEGSGHNFAGYAVVKADFARTLERKLTASRTQVARLRKALSICQGALFIEDEKKHSYAVKESCIALALTMEQCADRIKELEEQRDDYHKKACEIADQRDKAEAELAKRDAVAIETCVWGHKFAKLPDHPTKDGLTRCPHCLAQGLDEARQYIKQAEEAMTPLRKIGERLHTQDSRCTENPMFCVQQKRRIHGIDTRWSDGETQWVLDGEIVEPGTEGAKEYGFKDIWETKMVAFTEQGCKEYLRQNGHNLREPRIYVESFNRCPEMIAIRERLMAIAPTRSEEGGVK